MKSVKETTQYTLLIKKSRFICTLIPCDNEAQIHSILQEVQTTYQDANHNCYAYIVGNAKKAYDDGEPSKTAGMPMLNVLEKQELTNIIAVVTRYFGGIKLGAGGLTRAYTQSVAEALKEATIVEKQPIPIYAITVGYHYSKKMEHLLRVHDIHLDNTEYSEDVTYTCYIKDESFFDLLQELTNNTYSKKHLGSTYVEIE